MARIRTIKPDFFRSSTVANLPTDGCRLTLVGLIIYVDDYGRGVDDVRLVKADVWPIDDRYTSKRIEADLAAIAKEKTLCRYAVKGRRYLHLPSWGAHQKVSHPTPSRIPPCPLHDRPESDGEARDDDRESPEDFGNDSGEVPSDSGETTERFSREGKGKERKIGKEGKGTEGDGARAPSTTNPTHVLSHLLADLIEANGTNRPNVTRSWLEDLETLVNTHGPSDVEAVVRWCQADQFWRGNVLASSQLKKHYDQLRLHSQRRQLSVVKADDYDPIAEYRRLNGLEA